jgi:glycosyltransferase involved in cell wall biosynthesis
MLVQPEVSVVIPTLRRPKLLLRALQSVFGQTFQQIEVIVVVDGPDEETMAALEAVRDPRLRIFMNPRSLTAAGARNVGVSHARGEWIAFLDDDDEWLADKLEKQIAFARVRGALFVSCLSQMITPIATFIWPEKIYDNAAPLDEYLFDRRTTFAGSSMIPTPSYFVLRALYEKSPFRIECAEHDDWDFLLRLSKRLNVPIETVPEALVKIYSEERRPSLQNSGTWLKSLAWIESVRPMLTPRAYSGFCLCVVGSRAANERAYPAFFRLLSTAFKNGSPRIRHVLIFLAFWVVPRDARRRLRALLRGRPIRSSRSHKDALLGMVVKAK